MLALLLALVGLTTIACSKPTAPSAPDALTFGVDVATMASAPVFLAEAKGFWKDEGLNVEIRPFVSGRLALDALVGNAVNAATVADIPVVFAAYQKHKVLIIATFSDSGRHVNMLARRDRGILSPGDLRRKRIAVPLGTAAEFVMDMFLQRNRISRSEVTVVALPPPDTVAAITRGDVDAIFTWQPHIYNGSERLGESAVIVPSEGIYSHPFNVVVLDGDLAVRAQALTKLLRGLRRAAQYMKANRVESVAVVASKLSLDAKKVEAIWNSYSFEFGLRPSMATQLREEGAWAKRAGVIKPDAAEPAYESLVNDVIERRLQ